MLPGYGAALEQAWASLLTKDLRTQAINAGASLEEGCIIIEVLGRRCVLDPRERSVARDGEELGTLASIVVLHYLANAAGSMPAGRAVSYRQLPGGNVFYGAFKRRVIDVLGEIIDRHPEGVLEALRAMGASRTEAEKFVLFVLPRLPVTVIIWRGDEEISSSAALLFEETAVQYLHIEDLAEVGTMIVEGIEDRVAGR